jgi:hypothetical protein
MDEIDFTLDGTRHRLTRDAVIKSMRRQVPGRIQTYAVEIDGVTYPVKQVLAQALQVPLTSFVSTRAQDLLTKLGFAVMNVEDRVGASAPEGAEERAALALSLAVDFFSGREGTVPDVLAAAGQFAAWLSDPGAAAHG